MDNTNLPRQPPTHEGLLAEIASQLKAINLKLDALTPPTDTEHFTLEQVAKKLHLSRSTMYRKIYSGEILASKVGRRYYINKSEFNKLFKT